MLEVKRKSDPSQRTETAAVGNRRLSVVAPQMRVDGNNARKPPVLGQSARAHHDLASPVDFSRFQTKVPVIAGEVLFRGSIPVDGLVSGQLGSSNGCLSVRQKPNAALASQPELDGELCFRDVVRVNGHIAGSVSSIRGTLIVDIGATVDADINVAIAIISGTVNGDIIARERVEIGPVAKIHGNIWTRAITIKDGAIFEGICRMLDEE